MVVEATVPEVGVRVTVGPKDPPEVCEISKPVGAVTTKLAVRNVPDTLKDCSADTVPAQVVKSVNDPEEEITLPPSLSMMVTIPVLSVMDAPTGFDKITLINSLDSADISSIIGMVKVFEVSPAAKVKVPVLVV